MGGGADVSIAGRNGEVKVGSSAATRERRFNVRDGAARMLVLCRSPLTGLSKRFDLPRNSRSITPSAWGLGSRFGSTR
jgi:hypothetical protein